MFTESGTLPIGVEYEGELCREFSLSPLRVKHSMEVRRSPDGPRCESDDELMGLALLGKRLSIDGVPREAMDLAFMENLFDDDLAEVMAADGRLQEEIARFRRKDPETNGARAAEVGDTVGGGPDDAPGRGA